MLWYALLAAGAVSLLSFSGALTLVFRPKLLRKILLFLVAFSAGAMMGSAFFHFLPEALELFGPASLWPFLILVGGFALFFILERFVFWHHCHATEDCKVHPFGYMNLVGDGLHNFLDGLVLAAAFLADTQLGIAATIAVISHEIPQEISDFGVLVHAGISPRKALLWNFLSAIFAILGVLIGWKIGGNIELFEPFLLAFAAGGFLYIAASDLIPELHKEENLKKASGAFIFFCLGLLVLFGLQSLPFAESAH